MAVIKEMCCGAKEKVQGAAVVLVSKNYNDEHILVKTPHRTSL